MSARAFTFVAKNSATVNDLLRAELPAALHRAVSNGKIRRLIVAGAVSVNGVQCRNPSALLRAGAQIAVQVDESKLLYEKQPDDISFELTARDVLFEDDAIIIVNKPAFFPTEAGMVKSRDNLHAAVVRYLFARQQRLHPNAKNPPYVGIMHRLDRETSGAILFTKTRAVNAACHDLFEKRTAQKCYRAVVQIPVSSTGMTLELSSTGMTSELAQKLSLSGLTRQSFTVELPLGRISPKSQAAKWGHVAETDGGLYARTDVSLVGTGMLGGKTVAYLDCLLHTGRTHQIRVHLASVGLPILGDTLYGGAPYERVMLHAHTLSFPHPVTGESITVTAPLPRGFAL